MNELLAKLGVPTLPQLTYSPDLAPCDFYLFPRLKRNLEEHRYGITDAVQQALTRHLNSIPVEGFRGAYEEWKSCWQRCVDANGEYFEEF